MSTEMYEREFKFLLNADVEQVLQTIPLKDKFTIYQTYSYRTDKSSVRVRKVEKRNQESLYYFCYKQNPLSKTLLEDQNSVLEIEVPISEEYYNEFKLCNPSFKEIVKTRWTLLTDHLYNGYNKLVWTIDKFENGIFVGECEGPTSWFINSISDRLIVPQFPPEVSPYVLMVTSPGKSILSQDSILGFETFSLLKRLYGENIVSSTK